MGSSEYVWARVGRGRTRRMLRSVAEAEGLEIDDRPGKGIGAAGVVRIHMSPEEKQEVFDKTGRRVESRDEIKDVYRATGLREAERGEEAYERIDALRECAETGKIDERFDFRSGNTFLYGDEAKRKPFDYRQRYLEHCARLGVRPD